MKKNVFLSLNVDYFVSANSSDPVEILHHALFRPGLHCLPE